MADKEIREAIDLISKISEQFCLSSLKRQIEACGNLLKDKALPYWVSSNPEKTSEIESLISELKNTMQEIF